MSEKLNTGQAAEFLGVPPAVLERARKHGIGPKPVLTLGYGYLYEKDELVPYLDNTEALVVEARSYQKVLRLHPRGTDEWCNPITGQFYKINRKTDPRYRLACPEAGKAGGYVLKDAHR